MKKSVLKKTCIATATLLTCTSFAHAQVANNTKTSSKELDAVIVSGASGFEQDIANAPASISVITRDELEKQSYTTVVDAVKNIPGVFTTGGGSSQEISIRGMTGNYTMYLIDGKPLSAARNLNTNGTDGGKYTMSLPPVSMIERIEVIRGPMSSLYGSEAMGGVINIITRKYAKEWQGTISTEYTKSDNRLSNDGRQVDVYASGPLIDGLLGLQINAAHINMDESDFSHSRAQAQKATESRPESKREKLGAKFILTPNANNDITLSVDTSTRRDTHTPGKSIEADNQIYNYKFKKDMLSLEHAGRYGDIHTSTYIQKDTSENIGDLPRKEEVYTLNNQTTYFAGKNTFTFGGQYKKEKLINDTNEALRLAGGTKEMNRWLGAIFAEAEWNMTDKFAVTTGLRYNRDQYFGGHFTPRIYANYHATDNLTFKGGVSTGYVQPTLPNATPGFAQGTGGSKTLLPGQSNAIIIGNKDVKPEKSTSFELGVNYNNQDVGINTSATVFYTQFKDKISEERICNTDATGTANQKTPANWTCERYGNKYYYVSQMTNIQEATMQGIELAFDSRLTKNLLLKTSYTFTQSEQKSGKFAGQPLNKMPKHMFNANLDWQATDSLSTWLQYNYRGATSESLGRTSMDPGTPGYGFFDIGLQYKLKKNIALKAGVYNVANKEVTSENYSVVLDGRRYNAGVSIDF